MSKGFARFGSVMLLAAGLAACSGSDTQAPPPPPPPPPPVITPPPQPIFPDQFGTRFGAAFRADPNSEATDPAPGDIIPLSFTTEPVNL